MSNNEKYYERSYKRIQEVISNIGGINQAITLFVFILNKLYNNFIILFDTKNLLFSLIEPEQQNSSKTINKGKSEYENNYKNIESMKQKSSNSIKSNKETVNIKFKRKINQTDCNFSLSKSNSKFYNNESNIKYNEDANSNFRYSITFNKIKENHNFWKFILFNISCEKKYNTFRTYEKFRMKLMSEEHMIRNHLNIYKLLKVTKTKNYSRIKSLHLKDLYNLI